MLDPLGPPVLITFFLDPDQAGDHLTRSSYSGILVYINLALFSWYRKLQNTVEDSSFGSEIIRSRIACEKFEALNYKLQMFGMQVEGPDNMYVDNE